MLRVLTAAMMIGSASAAPFPDLDVDAHCSAAAKLMGGFSKSVMLICLQQEQKAYDALKKRWQDVPEDVQAACAARVSYDSMRICIDSEINAAKDLAGFKFKK